PGLRFAMYWILGSARLDLARVWVASGLMRGASELEQTRFRANLASAKQDLLDALAVDADEATSGGEPNTRRAWKIHSALAWHAILEGDSTEARTQAQRAKALNPGNPYAALLDRAIAAMAPGADSAAIPTQR